MGRRKSSFLLLFPPFFVPTVDVFPLENQRKKRVIGRYVS